MRIQTNNVDHIAREIMRVCCTITSDDREDAIGIDFVCRDNQGRWEVVEAYSPDCDHRCNHYPADVWPALRCCVSEADLAELHLAILDAIEEDARID